MFADELYPVPQGELLIGPALDRGLKSRMADRHRSASCYHPSDVLPGAIPQFDAVMQVRDLM